MPGEAERAALAYLRRGWSVIPMRPRDKRPAVRWQGYETVRATEAEVVEWFRRWPDANVGIVTGSVSGLVVFDVDPAHGGEASLRHLSLAHGPLPATPEVSTGGGGRHLYFGHPGGEVRNRVGLAPGLDLRGDGGCVVAPPSIHPSGAPYRWAPGRGPDRLEPAPMPRWLARAWGGEGRRLGHPLAHWRQLLREGAPEGERNNAVASLAGHLLWHGVDPEVCLELLLAWNRARCRPPLPDDEVVRTVESITRLHERDEEG